MFARARLGILTPRPRYFHHYHPLSISPYPLARPCLRHSLFSTRAAGRSSSSHSASLTLTRRNAARLTLGIAAGAAVVFTTSSPVYASSAADDAELAARPALSSLVRAYAVYSMCSVPALVDAAPTILATLSAVPGIRQITEAFVRVTFFNQFVGADSAEDAVPLLHELRQGNKGALLAYSVEVDENEAAGSASNTRSHLSAPTDPPHKLIIEETLHCIDVAADFEASIHAKAVQQAHSAQEARAQALAGRRTWIAVKFTAMLPDAHALIALSSHITEARQALPDASCPEKHIPFPGAPRIDDLDVIFQEKQPVSSLATTASEPSALSDGGLTPAHLASLRELYEDLRRICGHARQRGVKIIVDAEYSWYQPAIDAMTLGLMREFNALDAPGVETQIQPTVYGTFQAYLRRTPTQLALALEDARKHRYALGVKLVRGAYHPHELAAHRPRALQASSSSPSSSSSSLSISPDEAPPVWTSKKDTDNAYNGCVRLLLAAVKTDVDRCTKSSHTAPSGSNNTAVQTQTQSSWSSWISSLLGRPSSLVPFAPSASSTLETLPKVPSIGVLFGTHNWDSCALILKELVATGLATEDPASPFPGEGIKTGPDTAERIAVGQLYGMWDDLTQWVVNRISCDTPFVIKYVPYGALAEVMPYLSRRAIENQSVLGEGAAVHERQRAWTEIWKRLLG